MVIDTINAQRFINGYSVLLAEVHKLAECEPAQEMMQMLNAARNAAIDAPVLIDMAALSLEADGKALPEDVLEAIRTIKVRRWIYLRDTTKYSILIDPDGKDAYAVLGLTQPLKEILGSAGVFLQMGIMQYQGAYVCDGLIASPVWLGANYMREFSDLYRSLKASDHFHKL